MDPSLAEEARSLIAEAREWVAEWLEEGVDALPSAPSEAGSLRPPAPAAAPQPTGPPGIFAAAGDALSLAEVREHLATRGLTRVPDGSTPACMICGKHFNFLLRRRHHCRRCGACVCDGCNAGSICPHACSSPTPFTTNRRSAGQLRTVVTR